MIDVNEIGLSNVRNFNGFVEKIYQSNKTINADEKYKILHCANGYEAKKLGKKVKIREDWNKIKITVMETALRQLIVTYPEAKKRLLSTGNKIITHNNYWGDNFWGNKGNMLGKLLMKIREEINNGSF